MRDMRVGWWTRNGVFQQRPTQNIFFLFLVSLSPLTHFKLSLFNNSAVAVIVVASAPLVLHIQYVCKPHTVASTQQLVGNVQTCMKTSAAVVIVTVDDDRMPSFYNKSGNIWRFTELIYFHSLIHSCVSRLCVCAVLGCAVCAHVKMRRFLMIRFGICVWIVCMLLLLPVCSATGSMWKITEQTERELIVIVSFERLSFVIHSHIQSHTLYLPFTPMRLLSAHIHNFLVYLFMVFAPFSALCSHLLSFSMIEKGNIRAMHQSDTHPLPH